MSNPGNKRLQRARHGAAPSSSLVKKTVTTTVNGRTFTVTRQEGSVLNNAGNMKFGLFPTIGKSMPFLLKLVDCCDKGKDISFGVVTESHLEPEPEPVYTPLVNDPSKVKTIPWADLGLKDGSDFSINNRDKKGPGEQVNTPGNIYWAINQWIEDSTQFEPGGAYEEYGPIEKWDTSQVTDMRWLIYQQYFEGWSFDSSPEWMEWKEKRDNFNADISGWDVSSVTNMSFMFNMDVSEPRSEKDRRPKFNQDISGWDVSNVTDMSYMFIGATSFNQPLNGWDVSNVTNMRGMFDNAISFNQPLNGWDVSSVTDMLGMFQFDSQRLTTADIVEGNLESSFNQDISGWDVSNVTTMGYMFSGANSFNQPLNGWDVSNVTNMRGMFYGANSFNQPLGGWEVSNVSDMYDMFGGATSFNQPLNGWDVSNVTTMGYMFDGATSFNQPLGGWDVSSVTDMSDMFRNATSFNQDLSGWDVSSVTYMYDMFNGATAIQTQYSSLPEDPVPADWNTYWP